MHYTCLIKGAPVSGAPFLFRYPLLVCLLFFCISQATQAAGCAAEHISERVQVVYVYDGDTVKLKDGRRLRFIGINTPETGYKKQASQAYADEAKAALQDLLDTHNRTLLLQTGRQNMDHYGRLLAHAFLEDGTSIAVRLLQKGLATTVVVPPDTWGHDCYQQQEDRARVDGLGLWGLDAYKAKQSTALPPNTRGFRIIRGTVQEVHRSKHSTWVSLDGPLVLHISDKDRVNFKPGFLQSLAGHQVETRGWVKPARDGLRMNVRHPAALAKITHSGTTPWTPPR